MTPEEYSRHLDEVEERFVRLWPYRINGSEASSLDEWLALGVPWELIERAQAITIARYDTVPRPSVRPFPYLLGVIRNLNERAEANRGEA